MTEARWTRHEAVCIKKVSEREVGEVECAIGVYDDGPDNVAEEAARVAYEIKDYMESISKEVGIEPKHGRWEIADQEEPRRYGCSVCKKLSWYASYYCPNCGAKMDIPTEKVDTPTENTNRPTDDGKTCRDCADMRMCIMSAPDGRWKACKDFVPKKMDEVEE